MHHVYRGCVLRPTVLLFGGLHERMFVETCTDLNTIFVRVTFVRAFHINTFI
jgi:hypothetical protein